MKWVEGYNLVDTFVECFYRSEYPIAYIRGYTFPHHPLPVKYNRDVESPYYYWLFITMTEIRLKSQGVPHVHLRYDARLGRWRYL